MSLFRIKKTPLRIQSDPLECGAVCLGIVLQYFGRYESTPALKACVQVSRMGSNARDLMTAAASFGLEAKAQRTSARDLKRLTLLGILFFDQCHFVVFEGFSFGKYYINDPGLGRYALSEKTFRARYGGMVITLRKGASFEKKQGPADSAREISSKDLGGLAALGLFFGFFLGCLLLLMAHLLTNIELRHSHQNASFLLALIAIFSITFILCFPLWKKIVSMANKSCDIDRFHMLEGLTNIPLDFFEDRPFRAFKTAYLGAFARHMQINRASALRAFYFSAAFVMLGFLATISTQVFLGAFLVGLIFALFKHRWRIKLSSIEFARRSQQQNRHLAQERAFALVKDMSAMGQTGGLTEHLMRAEMAVVKEDLRKLENGFFDRYSFVIFIVLFWMVFTFFAAFFLGATHLNELITGLLLGSFWVIMAHMGFAYVRQKDRFISATSFLGDLQGFERAKPPAELPTDLLVAGHFSHRFAQAPQPIFCDATINIKRGRIYGLVGPALSGKSTLLKVIAKKQKPSKNELVWANVEGHPLKIGLIDGDSDVFLGTLKDNVSLWNDQKTEKQIAEALSDAVVSELFLNRPLGLLSPIQAQGRNLSSGQKKCLMLARALLQSPDLLVLDNFFEALDEDCARQVLNNIKKLNIACVFSSFDEALLNMADEIIFLDNGGLKEGEDHKSLLQKSAAYQHLLNQGKG